MAPSSERVYTEAELDHIVAKRLAEKQRVEQEEKWTATVNAGLDALNRHISADGAHPRLLDLLGRSVMAVEKMERMVSDLSPEDAKKYLPMAVAREKREVEDREERQRELKRLIRAVEIGFPTMTAIIALVEVVLRLWVK